MPRISRRRSWSDSSRRLTIVFVAVLVPAAVTLVWLALRLLEQDRALWAQRDVERLEAAGDAVVRSLAQSLAEVERRLAEGEGIDGALVIARSASGVEIRPRAMAAWSPIPPPLRELLPRAFESAERLEFQGAPAAALAEYRGMSRSSAMPEIRAGALMRAARINRAQGRLEAAIADYRSLSRYEGFAVSGAPVDLLARRRICELLLESGDTEAQRREAELLVRDFLAGRWALSRNDWELTEADLSRWMKVPAVGSTQVRALSMAVDHLVHDDPPRAASGRRVTLALDIPITIVWRGTDDQLAAAAIPPDLVGQWVDHVKAQYPDDALAISLVSDGGAELTTTNSAPAGRIVRRSAGDTGLPWTLTLSPGAGWSIGDEFTARRRLLMAGLAALGLLLSAGTYLLWRVVQRELAVARLWDHTGLRITQRWISAGNQPSRSCQRFYVLLTGRPLCRHGRTRRSEPGRRRVTH